ncbi:conserved hypothetical protein [Alkaliphilus metalliredigens QYMF]|uniref:Uncharacterized protein n=1 Tax=Alkaliphilus metalliredigens (strain QYMF) TaxID=293826 RepID=A6TRD0_ALKMQ|nr:hypothetical protein [Alkaliphilus metalliredigens]ABR48748.1 conserved hypothetical protein [Alkaliphilus metalliredigens QYMF]
MIKKVRLKHISEIIDNREPIGLFYAVGIKIDSTKTNCTMCYVGVDNSTGDAWAEDFRTEEECIAWLKQERLINKIEVYKKALVTWGQEAQITMVFEEMAELQKELCKVLRGEKVTGNIAEEIADVEIMLEQMKLLFEIEGLVRDNKIYKLERLAERLEDQ